MTGNNRPEVNGGQKMGRGSFAAGRLSYKSGAALLAAVNIVILLFAGRIWGITGGLVLPELIQGNFPAVEVFTINTGVVLGSFYSIKISGDFRLRGFCSFRRGVLALAGGLMMGYSARIAGGCNIRAMVNGVASFSLHGVIFTAFVFLGVYAGSRLARKLYS